MSGTVRVNVGCGRVWHRDWVNLDHRPTSPHVRHFDIRKPLPFPDGTVDAVYASHVLEHLDMAEGRRLLAECRRILKRDGVVRIVVPDLEDMCRFYLQRLAAVAERPDAENETAYDWAYLQLIDQHVRRRPGGELMAYLERPGLLANPALEHRLSREIQGLAREQGRRPAPAGLRAALRRWGKGIVRAVLPASTAEALRVGRFLQTGEIHRVGYDRFSLPRLLREVGFDEVAIVGHSQSRIQGFDTAGLDCIDGAPRKPGSLFVEGVVRERVVRMPSREAVHDVAA